MKRDAVRFAMVLMVGLFSLSQAAAAPQSQPAQVGVSAEPVAEPSQIDWTADSENMWTVQVGGGIGKLPVNISTQAYYNVVTPENGADWQLRLQMQFLFPK